MIYSHNNHYVNHTQLLEANQQYQTTTTELQNALKRLAVR